MAYSKRVRSSFIAAFRRIGTVEGAAKATGVSKDAHFDWMKRWPDYREAFEEASIPVHQMYMDEVTNRAIHGWIEPVFSNGKRALDFEMGPDGKLVMGPDGKPKAVPASVLKKSDACLLALCAARLPGFSQKSSSISIGARAGKEEDDDRDIEITVIHKSKPVPVDDEPGG